MPRKTKPTALADQAAKPQFHIPAELLAKLDAALAAIESVTDIFEPITEEQMRAIAKMGDRLEPFCRLSATVLPQYPQAMPPSFSVIAASQARSGSTKWRRQSSLVTNSSRNRPMRAASPARRSRWITRRATGRASSTSAAMPTRARRPTSPAR